MTRYCSREGVTSVGGERPVSPEAAPPARALGFGCFGLVYTEPQSRVPRASLPPESALTHTHRLLYRNGDRGGPAGWGQWGRPGEPPLLSLDRDFKTAWGLCSLSVTQTLPSRLLGLQEGGLQVPSLSPRTCRCRRRADVVKSTCGRGSRTTSMRPQEQTRVSAQPGRGRTRLLPSAATPTARDPRGLALGCLRGACPCLFRRGPGRAGPWLRLWL